MIYDFSIDIGIINACTVAKKPLKVRQIAESVMKENNVSDLNRRETQRLKERVYRHVKKLETYGYVFTKQGLTELKTPILTVTINPDKIPAYATA